MVTYWVAYAMPSASNLSQPPYSHRFGKFRISTPNSIKKENLVNSNDCFPTTLQYESRAGQDVPDEESHDAWISTTSPNSTVSRTTARSSFATLMQPPVTHLPIRSSSCVP